MNHNSLTNKFELYGETFSSRFLLGTALYNSPQLLRDAGPRIFDNLSREAGYALGFFFFWAIAALASALSVYMIRTARRNGRPAGDEGQRQ